MGCTWPYALLILGPSPHFSVLFFNLLKMKEKENQPLNLEYKDTFFSYMHTLIYNLKYIPIGLYLFWQLE